MVSNGHLREVASRIQLRVKRYWDEVSFISDIICFTYNTIRGVENGGAGGLYETPIEVIFGGSSLVLLCAPLISSCMFYSLSFKQLNKTDGKTVCKAKKLSNKVMKNFGTNFKKG